MRPGSSSLFLRLTWRHRPPEQRTNETGCFSQWRQRPFRHCRSMAEPVGRRPRHGRPPLQLRPTLCTGLRRRSRAAEKIEGLLTSTAWIPSSGRPWNWRMSRWRSPPQAAAEERKRRRRIRRRRRRRRRIFS